MLSYLLQANLALNYFILLQVVDVFKILFKHIKSYA